MKVRVYKLLVLGMIVVSFTGCSLWDTERGHDDDNKVTLSEKDRTELVKNLHILEGKQANEESNS